MAKAASLVEGVQGGMLDDCNVEVVSSTTGEYTYPSGKTTNALIWTLRTEDGVEHTEAYSSGQAIPSDDGTGFDRKLDLKSKAKQVIDSLIALKFPGIDNSVKVFEGAKLHVYRKALPKMAGIDKEGDRDKTVLLADKVIALPGQKAARPTPPVKSAAPAKPQTATQSATAASTANGDALDEMAVAAVLGILAGQPENTIGRLKLGTQVLLTLTKTKGPEKDNMAAIKKLATDEAWLTKQMERDPAPWVFSEDTITAV